MATLVVTLSPGATLLGVLKPWLDNLSDAMERKRLILAMNEVESAKEATSNKTGGKLKLGNLVFQEYKVNTKSADPLRYFGFFYGNHLHVAAIATSHKNQKYGGMTWDGNDEFPATFVSATSDVDSMVAAAFDDELLYRAMAAKKSKDTDQKKE